MKMKRFFAIVIAVLTITTVITFSDNAEGDNNLDGKSKDTAINRDITLNLNETKLLYFNTNVNNFEFVKAGDGYTYTLLQTNELGNVQHVRQTDNGEYNDTWPKNGQFQLEAKDVNIVLMKNGHEGFITVAVTLTATNAASFYLKFTVVSYGLTQVCYYKINVAYDSPEVFTFDFEKVNMDYEGIFSTTGKMYSASNQDVTESFKYYAIGLYSGISIHNDLSVTGIVDDTDASWFSSNKITFTIVATHLVTHEVYVCPATIEYTYDRTFETGIEYTLKEGSKTLLTETSTNKTATVMENADLTLSVEAGTSAWIVFSDDSGIQKKYLWTPMDGSSASPIATNGAGRYDISLKQLDGSEDSFTVNVIATFVPVNKIYVTCSPV